MKRFIPTILILFFLLASCGSSDRKVVKVALDPSFFPMELLGREPQVLAFCNELLQELSKHSSYRFERVVVNWDDLLDGLDREKFDAVISSVYPYVFNLTKYAFSQPFLMSGPVLVSRIKGPTLKHLKDKEVGVLDDEAEQMLVEVAATVLPRRELSISTALMKILDGELDAAFLDVIPTLGYIDDLYYESLSIKSKPIDEHGLRFLTLNKYQKTVMRRVEKALTKVKKSGELEKLRQKWKIAM